MVLIGPFPFLSSSSFWHIFHFHAVDIFCLDLHLLLERWTGFVWTSTCCWSDGQVLSGPPPVAGAMDRFCLGLHLLLERWTGFVWASTGCWSDGQVLSGPPPVAGAMDRFCLGLHLVAGAMDRFCLDLHLLLERWTGFVWTSTCCWSDGHILSGWGWGEGGGVMPREMGGGGENNMSGRGREVSREKRGCG